MRSAGRGSEEIGRAHELQSHSDLVCRLLLEKKNRFRDAETFTSWYKLAAPHAKWLTEAVYGIPELYSSEISQARLIANPGCYATSVILALRPLTQAGLLAADSGVVCDCQSGASGA